MKEVSNIQKSQENRSVAHHMTGRKGISAIPPSYTPVQRAHASEEEETIQKAEKTNNTGLPDNLKAGIENLSGYSMDDVKVHYNSAKPAQLEAHAYAQGTDIHLASGQEKHLPHEAWHVVQQKQGRVKPTIQLKDKVNINDDTGLENEADVMGAKALQLAAKPSSKNTLPLSTPEEKQGLSVFQLLPWPKKKDRPKCKDTSWEEEEDEIKELYEWCNTREEFDLIIASMDYDKWSEIVAKYSERLHTEMESISGLGEMASLIEFFDALKPKAPTPKVYDMSTYTFPSDRLSTLIGTKGLTDENLESVGLRSFVGTLKLADQQYSKHSWEKTENSALMSLEERTEKNAEIADALEEVTTALDELCKEKTRLDAEAAAAALYALNVATMVTNATALPAFAGVNGNPLAKSIWEASVANAGKTGYIQVDDTIYPKATVTTATALLRTFSFAYTAVYPNGTQYLSNPHTPGGGNPSDKTGHSNMESRTSKYQADFIATWGGSVTVVHINSDSV
ncbi:MAG: DUF4157 domain-containing protein [Roseivirga sp.]|nr:DUF4157 domain-containing protein [Roseivirga sp.]